MRVLVLTLLAAGLLAGCANEAKIAAGTQQSMVVQFDGKDLTKALERATAYCGTLGKQASLQGLAEKNHDSIATFTCL